MVGIETLVRKGEKRKRRKEAKEKRIKGKRGKRRKEEKEKRRKGQKYKRRIGEMKKRVKKGNIGKGRLVPASSLHVWWDLSPQTPYPNGAPENGISMRGITKAEII